MLVDINLLPQKEAKNKSLLTLAIVSSAILLIGVVIAVFLNNSYNSKLAELEDQISLTEQLVEVEQQKIVAYQSSNSITDLENTVKWAQSYPLKTVPVLKNLTAILPERGFIQSFTYEETGSIRITVQFEMSREAAYFLNSLLESSWVNDAKLNSLDAVTNDKFTEMEDIEDERTANYIPRYLGQYEIELNREVLKENGDPSLEEGRDDE
ncbi:fimbrial protein [Robertmurraya massiliosenegalensis]|uniref:PilN domain-containing protein n=1 Tax=Robertmurraya TaxID=2837507 RepID=UPI0039A5F4D4